MLSTDGICLDSARAYKERGVISAEPEFTPRTEATMVAAMSAPPQGPKMMLLASATGFLAPANPSSVPVATTWMTHRVPAALLGYQLVTGLAEMLDALLQDELQKV